jgi:S1-C subfamily serine protease
MGTSNGMNKKNIAFIIIVCILFSWTFDVLVGRYVTAKISTWPLLNRLKILSPQTPIVITNRETVRVSDSGDVQQAATDVKSKISLIVYINDETLFVSGGALNLTSDGGFLTAASALADKTKKYLVLLSDGRSAEIKESAVDPATSLVFLKADLNGVPTVNFGNANELKPGEKIVFVHNSIQNFNDQVSLGLVNYSQSDIQQRIFNSDYPRRGFGAEVPGNLLLPGQVIIDTSGEAVGIWNGQDIISSDVIKQAQNLYFKNTKQISRPAFGFSYSIITPNENRLGGLPEGALVKNVEAVSAARRGGLLLGDVIVSVDGNKISENSLLEELLNKYSAGSQVNLSVRRGKQDISLVLTAAELKP